jgi:hypothetical protein
MPDQTSNEECQMAVRPIGVRASDVWRCAPGSEVPAQFGGSAASRLRSAAVRTVRQAGHAGSTSPFRAANAAARRGA